MSTEQLIATLAEEVAPVKAAASPFALLLKWMVGAALYVAASVVLFLTPRPDLAVKLHTPMFLGEILLLALIALTAAFSAITLSYPDMHQKRWVVFAPLAPLAAFIALLYSGWVHDAPPAATPDGMDCLVCITLLSVVPGACLMYYLRKQASTHYYLTGGIALLASSSLGCLALRLSEQTDSMAHLVTWHYLPMAGIGTAGLWLGRKFLKW